MGMILQDRWNKSLRRGSAISQAYVTLFVEEKLWRQQQPETVHSAFDTDLNSKLIFSRFSKNVAFRSQSCFNYKEGSGMNFLPMQYIFQYLNSKTPAIYGLF